MKSSRAQAGVWAIGGVVLAMIGCSRPDPAGAIVGVRLGMSPRDVRTRFDARVPGTFRADVDKAGDPMLEWRARAHEPARAGAVTWARFEFHGGMLVAIRAKLAGAAKDERAEITPKIVRWRGPVLGPDGEGSGPQGDGVDGVIVLARDCPTHHDEAERLVTRSASAHASTHAPARLVFPY